jgi:hypothetical protein
MNDIAADELQSLIDECIAIHTEADFEERWVKIAGYHAIGRAICKSKYKNDRKILSRVTIETGIKERNIYRAIQFYEMCPDLELLQAGKNISWRWVCNKYLPAPKDKEEPEMCVCPTCGREHKKAE